MSAVKQAVDSAQAPETGNSQLSRSKPYAPFEPFGDAGSSHDKSTGNPSVEDVNPSVKAEKEEKLAQNEVAEIVSAALQDMLVWDTAGGQWFHRANLNSPFTEQDSESSWLAISEQVALVKPQYTSSFVNGVETFVRAQLKVSEWNTSRHLLPVQNGVLDLKTNSLRPYSTGDRFNWQLPYPYDSAAECPLIQKTISRMVNGNSELMRFLYAWLLVVLLGRYDVHAFVELVGRGGTGKSTFLTLMTLLVGDENIISTDLHNLEHNQFETAALYGKRLAIVSDSAMFRGELPTLKAITGGDAIRLERKHRQQRKPYVYRGLVLIAANQPLESSDYSSGLKRRRRSLSIDYKVSDEEKAPYLVKEDYPEGFNGALKAEMSGLLNILLAMDVTEAISIVTSPEAAMQAEGLAIELETNPLLAWCDDNLIRCTSNETRIGDKSNNSEDGLYINYCQYVEAKGQRPVSITRFSRIAVDVLTAHGVDTVKHRNTYTYLVGLRLRRHSDEGCASLISDKGNVTEGLNRRKVVAEGCEGYERVLKGSDTQPSGSPSPTDDKVRV